MSPTMRRLAQECEVPDAFDCEPDNEHMFDLRIIENRQPLP